MEATGEEQLDFDDEEYGGGQKMPYQGSGAIPALADDDMMGEDDDFDDLYNDVNVGEGFLQMHRSEAQIPPAGLGNGGYQTQKHGAPEVRVESGSSQMLNIPGLSGGDKYSTPEQKVGLSMGKEPELVPGNQTDGGSVTQKERAVEMNQTAVRNLGFQGSAQMPHNVGLDHSNAQGRVMPPNSANPGQAGMQQLPVNQIGNNVNANTNMNRPVASENYSQPVVENGPTMLFVGELHWWTTDAELESMLSQYGRVKEIKFFDERASGKSKGYCQVEFYEAASAAACKDGMNGFMFNGRACVVAFASSQTLKQMGASYANKNQSQPTSQSQGRRPINDGQGRGGGMNYQGGDGGRNFGRGGWGRGGQGIAGRGPGSGGPIRGRGGAIGAKGMTGGNVGVGNGTGAGGYGQGLVGPAFGGPAGGMMHPQNMMGTGFDPTYMGRGGGYGGFPGPTFPGMFPTYPAVNAMGLAGVAPHVNPAFFGRGMTPNGMGMMGATGMDGHHAGMWTDTSMGGWAGEEHGHKTRESSYGGEDGASEYGYGEASHEKGVRSGGASREKDRGPEREWSGNSERKHHEDREYDEERSNRDHRYREEKDGYRDSRQRGRDSVNEDDWDRGQSSSRSRSRSGAVQEENHSSRSRDVDYGKRRRMPSE